VQRELVEKRIDLWVIDAFGVAAEVGMGNRINTVMQPCFFQLSGVLPADEAIARIKEWVTATYAKRGESIVARNHAAIDRSLERLVHVPLGEPAAPEVLVSPTEHDPREFVRTVTAALIAGRGDQLPVSALPVDGTFPTGTTRYEKRAIAQQIPVWDPAICIDCGKCAAVCPHATIRMKVFPTDAVAAAPDGFKSKEFKSRELLDHRLTIQVAPDDCTGCGVCVEVCPAKDKTEIRHKAINMEPVELHRDLERPRWDFFQSIAPLDRSLLPHDTVKGSQVLEPLFEFSGACGGCGETPYLKLVSQLFGDRMIVANATGCSSIYGANLPTTPWTVNAQGRGRRGPTRCSRTTPSSGSACGWPWTPRSTTRACCSSGLLRTSDPSWSAICSARARRPRRRSRPSASGSTASGSSSKASRETVAPTPSICWRWPATW
jgi:pyruvate-ferredoxin/flavodoxin oxidoreductase